MTGKNRKSPEPALRIIFMGTPQFAVPSLEALLKSRHQILAVVTAPDRPAGRGKKLRPSAVKAFAEAHQLPVWQPTNLKDPGFLNQLREAAPDLIAVVAFRMLPREVWSLPARGTVNLHASLLPQYRGAAPINWALINGEEKTGVTTFLINERIDTGDLLQQEEVNIAPTDNAGSLHDKLMHTGAGLLRQTVDALASGHLKPQPQKAAEDIKPAPKIYPADTYLHPDESVTALHRKVRGLSPYPGARALIDYGHGPRVTWILRQTHPEYSRSVPEAPGQLVTNHKDELKIALQDGYLHLEQLQPPNKKNLNTREFLNGHRLETGAKMTAKPE